MTDFFFKVRSFIELTEIHVIPPKCNRRRRKIKEEDAEVPVLKILPDPSWLKLNEKE